MTLRPASWIGLPAALALAACAAPPRAGAEPVAGSALLLVAAADWAGPEVLAAEAARRAGVPVLRATPVAARTWALALDCASAADCLRAAARLAADKSFAVEVQADARRALPAPPARTSAQ